jgi:hypothetical protein
MAVITVKIPDQEVKLFLQLLDKFKYKPSVVNDEIPAEIQNIILNRKKTARSKDYISSEQSLESLKKKYGF